MQILPFFPYSPQIIFHQLEITTNTISFTYSLNQQFKPWSVNLIIKDISNLFINFTPHDTESPSGMKSVVVVHHKTTPVINLFPSTISSELLESFLFLVLEIL